MKKELFDTGIKWTLDDAKKAACVYLELYGWDRIEFGKLVRDDGKEIFAVKIPSRVSPNRKFCDLAREWRMDSHRWERLGAFVAKK